MDAPEPCHLIEVEVRDADTFDWGRVTQALPGQPRANWQVPWDERPLDYENHRWAFFFHYLAPSRPLLTPEGEAPLPEPSPIPDDLNGVRYEAP